ncbi:glycosyltransferase [Bacillus mojavensis]|uniref:glycosyltransferase n=1 Tax=Bacillus mojavensis subgroup TaxID=653388 RepID=UPI000288701E|nr:MULTISPECIES: glycosyltransferase [Bacillus mojavensis subgroup]MDG3072636.1 glycosyltransferase [Bacillus halotolerans]MDL5610489.1 glycosyltransferase [Bacillus halotolerans]MDR4227846.1 glycosyltransferase [Bacillus mojavensis]MEC1405377.1 glycosyltransferase [Bacillus halotolerans]MEC3586482.1 glycosyltransferase [Bacillus mojavensis]
MKSSFKTYMLMFGGIPAKPTGLATSVIRRSNAFSAANIENEILVHDWYINYDESINYLQDTNQLNSNTTVRYLYNELGNDMQRDDRKKIDRKPQEEGWVAIQDKTRKNVYRCYKEGLYLQFKWYNDEGDLLFIDHLLPNFTREKREWFDSKGYIRKVEYMDFNTNSPVRVLYLNKQGKCFLTVSRNPKSNATNQIIYFDENGHFKAEFKNEKEMLYYWLAHYILVEKDKKMALISEYGFNRLQLQKLESQIKNLNVIYTFHSNHFAAPYLLGSPIRNDQKDFFNHISEYSAVVFLTEEQRADVGTQYGNSDKYYAIPHHAPKVVRENVKRDAMKVVLVGRYEKIKNQDHAIKAFKKVVEQIPEAKLELYGRGSEELNLRKLITDLELEKNVELKGFSDDVYSVFFNSALSIVPSEYEGICLSLMESMSAGCVPISYNFKYGPKDIITHNTDGMIVQKGDINELANAIIDLLNNSQKRNSMSIEAMKITDKFSENKLVDDWKKLFEEVLN